MTLEMQKLFFGFMTLVLGFSFSVSSAFAHATVKPAQVGVGSFTDFTLGVPSEKEASTIGVKLTLPQGLNNVSPIVKPGWKIVVHTSTANSQPDDDGNLKPVPTEIEWTGGQIPAEQKDLFSFSTQVPSQPTELVWKIEQTYDDGSVISWTQGSNKAQPKDENGKSDFSKFGPASKTMVVNDLQSSAKPEANLEDGDEKFSSGLSVVAFALAVVSIVWQVQSRKKK